MPDSPTPETPTPASTRGSSRRSWLLPPALAVAAIGLQLLIDVPHHELIVDDEPEPPAKTTTAARTPRPYKPREAAYIAKLRKRWAKQAIADEPIDPRFADRHEDLLRAVVRKAEAAVAPADEPLSLRVRPRCHTVRCELELCPSTDDDDDDDDAPGIDAVAEQLPRFHVGRRALWHELRAVDPDPSADPGCRWFIVDFAVEGADPRYLVVRDVSETDAGGDPAKPAGEPG